MIKFNFGVSEELGSRRLSTGANLYSYYTVSSRILLVCREVSVPPVGSKYRKESYKLDNQDFHRGLCLCSAVCHESLALVNSAPSHESAKQVQH